MIVGIPGTRAFFVIYDDNPGPFFSESQRASCFHLSFLRAPHVFSCVCFQRAPSSTTFSFISFPSLRAPHIFLFLFPERPMSSLAFILRVPHLLSRFLPFLFPVSDRLMFSYVSSHSVHCLLLRLFSARPIFYHIFSHFFHVFSHLFSESQSASCSPIRSFLLLLL